VRVSQPAELGFEAGPLELGELQDETRTWAKECPRSECELADQVEAVRTGRHRRSTREDLIGSVRRVRWQIRHVPYDHGDVAAEPRRKWLEQAAMENTDIAQLEPGAVPASATDGDLGDLGCVH